MRTTNVPTVHARALRLLCCPVCRATLRFRHARLCCTGCRRTYAVRNGIYHMLPDVSPELALTIEKWDEFYRRQLQDHQYLREQQSYLTLYAADTERQLSDVQRLTGMTYLEIGSGPFFLGQELASRAKTVIGIDICPSALEIARRMLKQRGIRNAILIQGDILQLPLRDRVIDLVYGGGVIEHFPDTQRCVNELYRVLKTGGVSFNTVPYLNLGSLTYRQVWGNIPNLPVLRQLAEFIHIRLLGARHMIFGFEMSFTRRTLAAIHRRAGFRDIDIDRFDVALVFEYAPAIVRVPLRYLARHSSWFWPMVKVIARKQ